MNRPIYFEIPSDDPEKLAVFYAEVFGWGINRWQAVPNYVTLFSGSFDQPGMNGGIMGRHMTGTVNTIAVEDIDLYMQKIEANGGKITTPKTEMPSLGYFAWCVDSEGNYMVLVQKAPEFNATMQAMAPTDTPDRGFVNRPIHFEIPALDPDKLAEFYVNVFGWQTQKWEGMPNYILLTTGDRDTAGIDGAITLKGDIQQQVNTIGVEDIAQYLETIPACGGQVLMPPELIPGVGQFTYCLDPDGNQFGLLQPSMPGM